MSKICVAVIYGVSSLDFQIKNEIVQVAKKNNLACFWKMGYTELFLEGEDLYSVISIADSQDYDNCEMFLLPDGCVYNGEKNKIPFEERILALRDFTVILKRLYPRVDWFIGNSGTPYDDFIHLSGFPNELPEIINEHYFDFKTAFEADLHIIVE